MNRLKGKVALVTGATRGVGGCRSVFRLGLTDHVNTSTPLLHHSARRRRLRDRDRMEGLHRDAVGGLIIECTTDMHHSTVSYLLGFPDAAIGAF
ncbi:MAG: hypothetical protein QOD04_4127 [Pseudonocardiales bacterium]|nr:hypothetical protein [Pseudonocardiales bacterium]